MQESTCRPIGPVAVRVRWEPDDQPYDWGDIDPTDDERDAVDAEGVWGCLVEVREPACPCCGRCEWEYGASLWSVTSPDDPGYYAEVAADVIAEAVA
jgi:hypothetical protein